MNHCLILIARYNPLFVKQELFPEIEKYCTEFGILSQTAYDIFQKNKFAKNSLYFHHLYAETDIPINQEYEAIAFSKNFRIQPNSIQRCHSKILCFFTAVHTRPSDHAIRLLPGSKFMENSISKERLPRYLILSRQSFR